MQNTITEYFQNLQTKMCQELEEIDDKGKFKEDVWEDFHGGSGCSRTISKGRIIEKGVVNFFSVQGKTTEKLRDLLKFDKEKEYSGTGISVVLHPDNPYVPILQMNLWYFELDHTTHRISGRFDLTPHYVDPKQSKIFHERLQAVCQNTDEAFYPAFKKLADNYFFIQHRNESRGVGGIFFDNLIPNQIIAETNTSHSLEQLVQFLKDLGDSFVGVYSEMIQNNHSKAYTSEEKNWQLLRRGRFIEFNLMYDRSTHLGMESFGRMESIFADLPPQANWLYKIEPEEGSAEFETLTYLKSSQDWLS